MAYTRKAFGPLLQAALIMGVCVVFFVGTVRIWLWYRGEPSTPGANLKARITAIVPQITTGSPQSRLTAIQSLGAVLRRFGPSAPYAQAIPAMRKALRDPEMSVREATAETLGILGLAARPATPELTTALKDEDLSVQIAAGRALLGIGGEPQVQALRALAEVVANPEPIPNRSSIIEVMQSVGEPGEDAAAQALARLLANTDSTARDDAVSCVAAFGAGITRILPALDAMLKSDDPALRYTAALAKIRAEGLNANPDPRAIMILAEAVSNTSLLPMERQSALAALYEIPPGEFEAAGMASVVSSVRPPMSAALRQCGLELARQLEHKRADIRLTAANLLHMINPEDLAGKNESDREEMYPDH